MSKLVASVSVRARFARSANLERDLERREPLDGYIVTSRALDVVERIAETAATGPAGGAWSLTGPYGSGKSSLALLIDAAFGGDSAVRRVALRLIDESSREVGAQIRSSHRRHGTESRGFHRGLVTAGREPLNRTVLWALYSAVLRSYGEVPSRKEFRASSTLKKALKDAESDDPRRTGPSPSALVDIARCLAEDAPLLLVIDEFGKNLEAIRDGGDADPYLLQQLAEAGQGSGLPIFVVTLQHLSFEDHLTGASSIQRREWAKVQGRFEDIAFVESASQTRALIGTVFGVHDDLLAKRISEWADAQAETMRQLGIADLADPPAVASCYPLHPLAALVLPELCNRHGQHERTLFSFLAGHHPASTASFLAETDLSTKGSLPTMGLDAVYDYFVDGSALQIESAGMSGRWNEIATRLRDAHGLTPSQTQLAKAVALLNLVSTTGTLRASRAILALTADGTDETLTELETAGVVTYRDFADEYRIWQGTDVDISLLLDTARQRVAQQSLVEILNEIDQPQPVVAARHSAKHDVLRVFSRRYTDAAEQVEPLEAFSRYDGDVLLLVDPSGDVPTLARPWAGAKPIVLCTTDGIPIAHHVFAGDTSDASTLPAVLADLAKRFAVGRICVVADRGLISAANVEAVAAAGFDHVLATRLRRDHIAKEALGAIDDDTAWVEVRKHRCRAADMTLTDGTRAIVVESDARARRDTARTAEIVAAAEAELLALERRVREGRLKDPAKIGRAAQRILGKGAVGRLFDVDIAKGRFTYHYNEQAHDYEQLLAGRYVCTTSLTSTQASTARIVAAYRQLAAVEARFRVLKDFLHLRPVRHWTEKRVRGHVAVCVYAAVIETLINQTLAEADIRDPDHCGQHLSANRAIRELNRIRRHQLTANGRQITLTTRRTPLQARALTAIGADTATWDKANIT